MVGLDSKPMLHERHVFHVSAGQDAITHAFAQHQLGLEPCSDAVARLDVEISQWSMNIFLPMASIITCFEIDQKHERMPGGFIVAFMHRSPPLRAR